MHGGHCYERLRDFDAKQFPERSFLLTFVLSGCVILKIIKFRGELFILSLSFAVSGEFAWFSE